MTNLLLSICPITTKNLKKGVVSLSSLSNKSNQSIVSRVLVSLTKILLEEITL